MPGMVSPETGRGSGRPLRAVAMLYRSQNEPCLRQDFLAWRREKKGLTSVQTGREITAAPCRVKRLFQLFAANHPSGGLAQFPFPPMRSRDSFVRRTIARGHRATAQAAAVFRRMRRLTVAGIKKDRSVGAFRTVQFCGYGRLNPHEHHASSIREVALRQCGISHAGS